MFILLQSLTSAFYPNIDNYAYCEADEVFCVQKTLVVIEECVQFKPDCSLACPLNCDVEITLEHYCSIWFCEEVVKVLYLTFITSEFVSNKIVLYRRQLRQLQQ